MVNEDGLRGITSNPTIFEKAIAGSSDYNELIAENVKSNPHLKIEDLFEKLAILDIQMAADILRPIFEESTGSDGFVSYELSPKLSYDTPGSIDEAKRLWKTIDRPNLMIKVPATLEGIPVVEALIADEINVNITLMFSLGHYEAVAQAYIRGLERCSHPDKVASVASFFISRIDKLLDKVLDENGSANALALKGKIAIANAKMVYKRFKEIFSGKKWENLAKKGAKVQKVLWASTSTKNPEYSDVLYVEDLIGSMTINTLPPITLNAFRDHGKLKSKLEGDMEEAEKTLTTLDELGINLGSLGDKLQLDGVKSFDESIDKLFSTLDQKRHTVFQSQVNLNTIRLGKFQSLVDKRLEQWKKINFSRRIWAKDSTLWSVQPDPEIVDRLGWLALPEIMHNQIKDLNEISNKVKSEGLRHIVLLGMGGSSLAPEVFQKIFDNSEGYPELIVLDSTHPSVIKAVENKIALSQTLFLVSSKSGKTIETLSLFKYFWNKIRFIKKDPGQHFIAITDPASDLLKLAEERRFRNVSLSFPDVGGRYSALTVFGLLPAALIGVNIHGFLDRVWTMSENCAFCVSPRESIGLSLGASLGELAKNGRDKITFFASPSLASFPVWLEQLIAESLGKDGKGIIPIVDEPMMHHKHYGNDRFFVYFFEDHKNSELDGFVNELERIGHPVIRINVSDKVNISQEIFSWEMAVASSGAILGINPFNQPNVQIAKELAKNMMEQKPKIDQNNEDVKSVSFNDVEKLKTTLTNWIKLAKKGNYFAIQAYLPKNPKIFQLLQTIRKALSEKLHLATTLGFGPRFLHSTGQLHKGGPNTGLFLQFFDEPGEDLPIPETNFTFGNLIHSQALGDFKAMKTLERRVIRINLKHDILEGLSHIESLISKIIVENEGDLIE
jgi:transaldolase/glucose-6-phosphate isomerase